MEDVDSIKLSELKALVIRPGDVLVLTTDRNISDDVSARIIAFCANHGVKAVVLGGGLNVAAVQKA